LAITKGNPIRIPGIGMPILKRAPVVTMPVRLTIVTAVIAVAAVLPEAVARPVAGSLSIGGEHACKFIVGLLVAVLTGVQLLVAAAGTETVPLQFLLVNDFHGHLRSETEAPGAAKLAATIEELRRENPEGTVLLGGGDMFAGTLDSNEFRGRPAIELMNALHFDGDVAGNHIFDFNRAVIARQALWAQFPLLAANIQDGTGKTAAPFVPGVLLERRGVRIGVVGLVTMDTPEKASKKNMQGLTFVAPVPAAAAAIRTLQQQGAQLIVLLVHMSTYQNRAGKLPGARSCPSWRSCQRWMWCSAATVIRWWLVRCMYGEKPFRSFSPAGREIMWPWSGCSMTGSNINFSKAEPLIVRTATADRQVVGAFGYQAAGLSDRRG
jgi:hypothetical protein